LDRVDHGSQDYALSAQEAEQLAERLVRVLNRKGGR
jgi:hypothetical protein